MAPKSTADAADTATFATVMASPPAPFEKKVTKVKKTDDKAKSKKHHKDDSKDLILQIHRCRGYGLHRNVARCSRAEALHYGGSCVCLDSPMR